MNTFLTYFKKEFKESIRGHRYIIMGFGFIFFAISQPVMLKLLPKMMEGKYKGDINKLFNIRGVDAFNQYIQGQVYQICILIITLALMNMISGEYNEKRLTFPLSKGASISQIIMAKGIHYSISVLLFLWMGISINVYYTGIVFPSSNISTGVVFKTGAFVSLYILFIIAMIICFSTFMKKGIGVAIVVLTVNFLSPIFSDIKGVKDFLPYNLMKYTGTDYPKFENNQKLLCLAVIVYVVVLYLIGIIRSKKKEVY